MTTAVKEKPVTAEPADVADKLSKHFADKSRAAQEKYDAIIGRLHAGENVAASEIEAAITEANKGPDDLQRDLQTRRDREQWLTEAESLADRGAMAGVVEDAIAAEEAAHAERMQSMQTELDGIRDRIEQSEGAIKQLKKTAPGWLREARRKVDSRRMRCRRYSEAPAPMPNAQEKPFLIDWEAGHGAGIVSIDSEAAVRALAAFDDRYNQHRQRCREFAVEAEQLDLIFRMLSDLALQPSPSREAMAEILSQCPPQTPDHPKPEYKKTRYFDGVASGSAAFLSPNQ